MNSTIIARLERARLLAHYAVYLGANRTAVEPRHQSEHLGAVIADAVLQAGVNYRTVVQRRVVRILAEYPETATLPGLLPIVEEDRVPEYLLWTHSTKLGRFKAIVDLLAGERVQTTNTLRHWLTFDNTRDRLLSLHGVGPKTYDYMCCLVGIDCIAVDRHVQAFAVDAGVPFSDYRDLQMVVSYAADLLGFSRRDFDAWIWTRFSAKTSSACASN